jgi:hypothetical protein
MATYTIIGGDGKEYGSVSAEDLHRWIAEGRLNAQTLAKSESDAAFRPLSTFPEFADAFMSQTPSPGMPPAFASSDAGREMALHAVKVPAIALIVMAGLGIAYYLFNLVLILSGYATRFQQIPPDAPEWVRSFIAGMHGPMALLVTLMVMALNGFVLFGALKMLRLQSYGLAIAAAIIAMLPCQCCCVLGLPFGIWALVVLNKPEVKSQFG